MRTFVRSMPAVIAGLVAVVLCTQSVTAAGPPPVVIAVGPLPAGGAGYMFCYPAAVPGPNPANPFGGLAGAATTLVNDEGVTASAATKLFYITDTFTNAVDEWAMPCPKPVANVAPGAVLAGPATGLNHPLGIAVDVHRGFKYVANMGNNTVSIFAIGAVGNVAPLCVLGGPATLLNKPAHIALEPGVAGAHHPGFLYVANFGNASLTVYPPNPCGNHPPAFRIKGALTKLATPFGIDAYTSGIPGRAGPAIYAADPQTGLVDVYNDGPPANQAPFQILGGPASTLVCPSDVRVSRNTLMIYVEDPCANNGNNPAGRIDAFAANAAFNAPPLAFYVAPPGIISNPLGLWLTDRN